MEVKFGLDFDPAETSTALTSKVVHIFGLSEAFPL